ncbi:MAG: hypothetical protein PHW50_02120 [Patescibacteria group bacterium]|nr:hypothetical protein [Patescibacteria group bacterium]
MSDEENIKVEKFNKLLSQRPEDKPSLAVEKWRAQIRAIDAKPTEKYLKFLKNYILQWKPGEWTKVRNKLEKLSLKQLREITRKVGIKYAGGFKGISKEELILTLDEADAKELKIELAKYLK